MTMIDASDETDSRPAEIRGQIAAKIAKEVRHGGNNTKLTKVTSLLHAFREAGTPTRFGEVRQDLEREGLHLASGWHLDSGLPDIRRTGVLKLSSKDSDHALGASVEGDDRIQMSVWGPDQVGDEHALPRFEKPAPTDVLWFNVDPPVAPERRPSKPTSEGASAEWFPRRRASAASAANDTTEAIDAVTPSSFLQRVTQVTNQLSAWCPGLNEEMVADLLRQDSQPKVETYGDETDGVRGVSAVAVIARETPSGAEDTDGVSEELVFQMVEMIVGEGWIVTCWHPSRIYSGTSSYQAGDSILREPVLSHVRYRWRRDSLDGKATANPQTSGDLGVYLARSLVETYGASHRMMERWIEAWEADFYTSLTCSDKAARLKEAAGEISNLLSMVGEFSRRLTAFEHGRWSTNDKSWFPAVSDRDESVPKHEDQSRQVEALAESVRSAKVKFAQLSVHIRDDLNLLMLQSTATQQESSEKVQSYLGKVTGLVLVPTLVAGLFGANTRLPGGNSWMGFELMLILMLVSSIVVYLAIHKMTEDRRHKSDERRRTLRVRRINRPE